ncbi:MAG TPA: PIN domain-containing protein [Nitrososphaeria archaeon]|nr:PIN domain-containing protein [Nitrososphaeria archaeon]
MSYLYDSSAIINLCGEGKTERLLEGWTLNLAFYELGNAVWKQARIHRRITLEEAYLILDTLTEVFRRLRKPEEEAPLRTLEMAVREDLTYYDAAYISAAIEKGLILVTDDERLYEVGRRYVKTLKSDEL